MSSDQAESTENRNISDGTYDDEEEEVIIDPPILITSVKVQLPGSVKIKHLSQELRDLLVIHLDVPSAISMGSWQMVEDFLTASGTFQLEPADPSNKNIWKPFENLHAQILVNALYNVERIDLLVKMRQMIRNNVHLQEADDVPQTSQNFSQAVSISNIPPLVPFTPVDATNTILVLHYEKKKQERINYKWFHDNLVQHLEKQSDKNLKVVDIITLEKNDGGNLLQLLEHLYPQFKHIIVCFNDSFIDAIKSPDPKKTFSFRKFLHDKTIVEFLQNNNRNRRFRCVVMPGITKTIETIWAMVTNRYPFPDNYNELLEKLLESKGVKVKRQSSVTLNEEQLQNEMRQMVTK
ncbi:hypothetical protein CRE_00162 [Caenorhabditis remanei]|uniref:Uncharacterized protein n=1 Tax=Caenorhabditis remanei TaxID=31234 RepID=E3LDH0_CAERE|nr:hypothetical protein CRE_00162 [Caenorhabditis remanei]